MSGLPQHAFRPDSEELRLRLRGADWLGREFSYAEHIRAVSTAPGPSNPALALVLCLEHPDKGAAVGLRMLMDANPENVRIIIVTPPSPSPPAALFTSMAHVRIDVDAACSAYMARNIGALFADASVLLFLSDVLRPVPRMPRAYLTCLAHEGVVAARGRITGGSDIRGSVFRRYNRTSVPHDWAMDLDENMAMDARTFFSLGGFDETLPPGFGAVDLSARIFARLPDPAAQQYCPEAEASLPSHGETVRDSLNSQASWNQINAKYAKDMLGYCVFWSNHFLSLQKGEEA